MRTGVIERASAEQLEENGANLGAVLLRLSRTAQWHDIEARLQQFLPRFQHLQVRSIEGAIHIYIEERGFSRPVHAERLSDETLQFLCLLALRIIAEVLKQSSLRTQVIVTTHSSAPSTLCRTNLRQLWYVSGISTKPRTLSACRVKSYRDGWMIIASAAFGEKVKLVEHSGERGKDLLRGR
jgi:hypothetical protein